MHDDHRDKVYVKTFGGFDLYYKGELVHFPSKKAKELLAVLIDRKGKPITLTQLAEILLEGGRSETMAKQAVYLAWYRLKQSLKARGMEGIVIKRRRTYMINKELILCDSYDMLGQVKGASNHFTGQYMPEYSWAEVTLSSLLNAYERQ